MYDTVIIRYGEIFLKSEYVKNKFERILADNIRRRMSRHSLPGEIVGMRHRLYIKTAKAEEVSENLKTVFGIVSLSPAKETGANMEDIASASVELAKKIISPGESFAVRAERSGTHSFSSKDVEIAVGSAILGAVKAKVDLDDPDKTVYVEIRDDRAFVHDRKIKGPGGLPYKSQGPLVSLLSTGIDSPVASYMMMRRGCSITVVHMGDKEEIGKIVEQLESFTDEKIKVYSIPYDAVLAKISAHAGKFTCVVCKRFMHRIAERVMRKEGALGIVSGENIGQVASQTLENLKLITFMDVPVYRPLVAMDKDDIIGRAKDIGTYELKTGGRCKYVPVKPATQSDEETIKEIEEEIGIEKLVKDAEERYIL